MPLQYIKKNYLLIFSNYPKSRRFQAYIENIDVNVIKYWNAIDDYVMDINEKRMYKKLFISPKFERLCNLRRYNKNVTY